MRTFHIILAFCIGLFTGYLCFNEKPTTSVADIPPDTVADRATAIDSTKAIADLSFKKRNDLLAGQLLIANAQLKDSRTALNSERNKIKVMQARLRSDSSASPCDTLLKQELAARIDTLNWVTDSLIGSYESKVQLADSTIALRDSQLIVCNNAYQDMKSLIQEQAARERQLTENLALALKQQKRKRVQNRFLAAGMLFVSGVTTSLIIKYKQ